MIAVHRVMQRSLILDLAVDAPIGELYALYAGLNDPVFDLEITPNRGDCLGVRGVACDLSRRTEVGEGLVLCMERQGRTRRDASDRRVWSRLVREAHGGGLATECEDDCERDRGSDPLPGD